MKLLKLVLLLVYLICFPLNALAEDKMGLVLDQVEEILIRVDSGVSLNSYAEALAQLKIDYKKAQTDDSGQDNPLLTDRFKTLLRYMDDYAQAWKWMEIDNSPFMRKPPTYISQDKCSGYSQFYGRIYSIPCVKGEILSVMKDSITSTKSAHFNGW